MAVITGKFKISSIKKKKTKDGRAYSVVNCFTFSKSNNKTYYDNYFAFASGDVALKIEQKFNQNQKGLFDLKISSKNGKVIEDNGIKYHTKTYNLICIEDQEKDVSKDDTGKSSTSHSETNTVSKNVEPDAPVCDGFEDEEDYSMFE